MLRSPVGSFGPHRRSNGSRRTEQTSRNATGLNARVGLHDKRARPESIAELLKYYQTKMALAFDAALRRSLDETNHMPSLGHLWRRRVAVSTGASIYMLRASEHEKPPLAIRFTNFYTLYRDAVSQ